MATPSSLATKAACYCFDYQRAQSVGIYLLASKAGLLGNTPAQLAVSAKCYCYSDGISRNVSAYLLAVQAGVSTSTPSSLASSAACYCYDDATFMGVTVSLLASIAGSALTPSALASAAICYCYDEQTARSVAIYLLVVINGLSALTPSALAALASCFCFNRGTWKKVAAYLLNLTAGGGSAPTLNVDIWQNFEFTAASGAMTAGMLAASAQGPGAAAATWNLRGSNIFATSTNGEKKTISNPLGIADNGTEGLNLLATGSTFASVEVVLGPGLMNTASAGLWFFVPTATSADTGIDLFQFTDGSGDLLALMAFRRIGGVYSIRCTATGLLFDFTLPAMGAFYWAAMKFTKLGTVSFALYDGNGMQVGTTQTTTDTTGHQTDRIRIGPEDTYGAITGVNVYWDDLVVDYTNAVFPLGP